MPRGTCGFTRWLRRPRRVRATLSRTAGARGKADRGGAGTAANARLLAKKRCNRALKRVNASLRRSRQRNAEPWRWRLQARSVEQAAVPQHPQRGQTAGTGFRLKRGGTRRIVRRRGSGTSRNRCAIPRRRDGGQYDSHQRPPGQSRRSSAARRRLALQGGGAHGAFTWGVLDRLLEEKWLRIDGISGTSAGAMNAAVLASAYALGGAERARSALGVLAQRLRPQC